MTDHSYFIEAFLNRAKETFGLADNIEIRRLDASDPKQLFKDEQYQYVRLCNVHSYFDSQESFYSTLANKIAPGGSFSLEFSESLFKSTSGGTKKPSEGILRMPPVRAAARFVMSWNFMPIREKGLTGETIQSLLFLKPNLAMTAAQQRFFDRLHQGVIAIVDDMEENTPAAPEAYPETLEASRMNDWLADGPAARVCLYCKLHRTMEDVYKNVHFKPLRETELVNGWSMADF